MQNGTILKQQIANYRLTGTYSGKQSLGQLGQKQGLQLPVSDSDLQKLAVEAYKLHPDGGAYSFVPAVSTYETKVFVRPGTNVAVVAFKGTDPKRVVDLYTDIRLATGHLGDTARIARSRQELAKIRKALPGYKLVLTGHSLGGSIAREISNESGVQRAVGFNTGYSVVPRKEDRYTVGGTKHHRLFHSKHPRFTDYLNNKDAVSMGSRYATGTIHKRYSRSWGLKAHKPTYYK